MEERSLEAGTSSAPADWMGGETQDGRLAPSPVSPGMAALCMVIPRPRRDRSEDDGSDREAHGVAAGGFVTDALPNQHVETDWVTPSRSRGSR